MPEIRAEETARGVFAAMQAPWHGPMMPLGPNGEDRYHEDQGLIADAIRVAVLAEREACAALARSFDPEHSCGWEECCAEAAGPQIATAIMARPA